MMTEKMNLEEAEAEISTLKNLVVFRGGVIDRLADEKEQHQAQLAERDERVQVLEEEKSQLRGRIRKIGQHGLMKPDDIAFPISADRVQPDRDGYGMGPYIQVTLYDKEKHTVGFMYNIDDWIVQKAIDGINKAALNANFSKGTSR